MRYTTALFCLLCTAAVAQTPQVPHKMKFAGINLVLHDDARQEIQKDVDALTQSPRYFNIKVERAKTYFPVIEKIFAEERLPDDFKYLVLQESALIADAVSVSDAVGFWQFKDFTALEMGLRVDKEIDERMNIVSSTRAAARYIKKNNFYFNNWLYALQAYQMGPGGAMKAVKDYESGTTRMDITSKTYWYVKKYLAHKIAFEQAVENKGEARLGFYENKNKTTSKDLAHEVGIEEEKLLSYNKWIRKNRIPDDKIYAVALPASEAGDLDLTTLYTASSSASSADHVAKEKNVPAGDRIKINGITALRAKSGESVAALADRAGIDVSYLLKCNDITISTKLVPGDHYFIAKKRARATVAYHQVTAHETLWEISQQYGVWLKKLLKYNRLKSPSEIRPGMTLWLSARKPRNPSGEQQPLEVIEVDRGAVFSWTSDPHTVANEPAVPLEQPETGKKANTEQEKTAAVTPPPAVPDKGEAPQTKVTEPDSVKKETPEINAETENTAVVQPPSSSAADSTNTIKIVAQKPAEHIVSTGETLYGISRKYDLNVSDLAQWNDLKVADGIKPGQVLSLQEKKEENKVDNSAKLVEIVHEVKSSDTLYGVARKYGVTIKELMDWNNKKDFNLTVGEKLKIYTR